MENDQDEFRVRQMEDMVKELSQKINNLLKLQIHLDRAKKATAPNKVETCINKVENGFKVLMKQMVDLLAAQGREDITHILKEKKEGKKEGWIPITTTSTGPLNISFGTFMCCNCYEAGHTAKTCKKEKVPF
ncbi:hypothetical protein FIBSPDRAFT_902603 [Athelia psychrophila]|uniref:CCHC-type domain-containing protein n=1 Tax=Athelia psychrophila TaxID=1759441 RepID=A0A167X183_9AGAM|nr:hypothetical protein FIBSPDRAFT_902603 [Fibularhizoctonia sp. CBS 109695]